MLSYIYINTCVWATIGLLSVAMELPSFNSPLEILDELNDAEVLKAVVSSMNEWQRRQNVKKANSRIKREEPSICYKDLGCFEAGYFDMLPSKPEEINTKFLLYPGQQRGRRSPPTEVPYLNVKEAFEWAKNGFNHTLPTKVLIHGFGSDCTHIWVYEMRSALMAVEEVNVICVDWENGAVLPNYVKAAANTRLVGLQLAFLLRGLVENGSLSIKNTHLIGFSLGAHVAGFTGAELGGDISRITGLDPAGPLFEAQDPRMRLDQTDANFVDVIHSNGENLILGGLGSYQPMGHVDFYPNGGRMQKGCSNLFVGAVTDIIWSSAVEGRSLCNHRRAYKFFTDSVSPRCHFPAFPCDSYEDFLQGKCFPCTEERKCGNMGYYADRSKGRGQLYLVTRDEEPFCAHQYHVKIETTPSQIPIVSYGKIQVTLIGDSNLNETFMMTRKEDEEMNLGDSISRILVPHPVLLEPVAVQILYSAYSGWLSSGLNQWRMDKLTISDSFGKTTSICKKNLILESGVAVILPLFPGECNLPKEADDRNDATPNITGFISPLETGYKESSLANINIHWKNENDNKISDSEASESSRAFNSRIFTTNDKDVKKEIVEPLLKPHSTKNARSHDPDKGKSEISEPILGPTTARNFGSFSVEPAVKSDYLSKIDNKPMSYNFYDLETANDWASGQSESKWKREGDTKKNKDPFEFITTTVQFLPERLAQMFEQAEKYARETILPLVSTYTPKFISDFIAPKENKARYLPLKYEETSPISEKKKKDLVNFDPPPNLDIGSTTPYSHIQKIKKKEKFFVVTPEPLLITSTTDTSTTTKIATTTSASVEKKLEVSRRARDDVHVRKNILDMVAQSTPKGIYIDLPVFESKKVTKYIPLFREHKGKP